MHQKDVRWIHKNSGVDGLYLVSPVISLGVRTTIIVG